MHGNADVIAASISGFVVGAGAVFTWFIRPALRWLDRQNRAADQVDEQLRPLSKAEACHPSEIGLTPRQVMLQLREDVRDAKATAEATARTSAQTGATVSDLRGDVARNTRAIEQLQAAGRR